MPPTETHRCCVCAIETEKRCAACSVVGTDLFFCSQEHQKLVWKVHKRFCGNSTFEHPLLDPEEAEHAKRVAFTAQVTESKTLAATFTSRTTEDAATAELFARDITIGKTYEGRAREVASERAGLVRRVLLRVLPDSEWRPLRGPLGTLARIDHALTARLGNDRLRAVRWFLPLMQRIAVLLAVVYSPASPTIPRPVHLPCGPGQPALDSLFCDSSLCTYTHLVVLDFIKRVVGALEGEAVAEHVREAIKEAIELRNSPGVLEMWAARRGMLDCL